MCLFTLRCAQRHSNSSKSSVWTSNSHSPLLRRNPKKCAMTQSRSRPAAACIQSSRLWLLRSDAPRAPCARSSHQHPHIKSPILPTHAHTILRKHNTAIVLHMLRASVCVCTAHMCCKHRQARACFDAATASPELGRTTRTRSVATGRVDRVVDRKHTAPFASTSCWVYTAELAVTQHEAASRLSLSHLTRAAASDNHSTLGATPPATPLLPPPVIARLLQEFARLLRFPAKG